MFRKRFVVVVILLLQGGTALFSQDVCAQESASQNEESRRSDPERKGPLLYTTVKIKQGEIISQDGLVIRDVTLSKIPESAFSSPSQVTGRVAKYDIAAGEVMLADQLEPFKKRLSVRAELLLEETKQLEGIAKKKKTTSKDLVLQIVRVKLKQEAKH